MLVEAWPFNRPSMGLRLRDKCDIWSSPCSYLIGLMLFNLAKCEHDLADHLLSGKSIQLTSENGLMGSTLSVLDLFKVPRSWKLIIVHLLLNMNLLDRIWSNLASCSQNTASFNPQTYKQSHISTVVQMGGWWKPSSGLLPCFNNSQRFYLWEKAFDVFYKWGIYYGLQRCWGL